MSKPHMNTQKSYNITHVLLNLILQIYYKECQYIAYILLVISLTQYIITNILQIKIIYWIYFVSDIAEEYIITHILQIMLIYWIYFVNDMADIVYYQIYYKQY